MALATLPAAKAFFLVNGLFLLWGIAKSMAIAMIVPLLCYLVVGAYAFWGSQLTPFTPRHLVTSEETEG
jgi:hypothetical protein